MDPTENSITPGRTIDYKFELPLSNGCPRDKLTNAYTDPRFNLIDNFQISEYELYLYNGIVDKLKNLPGYDSAYFEKKKQVFYHMYTRPTIFWNLTCETRTDQPAFTRREAAEMFRNTNVSMKIPILMVV